MSFAAPELAGGTVRLARPWTLLWESLVHEAPVGLRFSRGMENTVVDGHVTANARRPLWDSSRDACIRSVENRRGPSPESQSSQLKS